MESQSLKFYDSIPGVSNVYIKAVDVKTGKVVATRKGHNVFVNGGRRWLRNTCAAVSFDGLADTGDQHLLDVEAPGRNAVSNFKPRWMAIGVGGTLQHWTTPGPGLQTESVGIDHLEDPIAINDTMWMKEILPSGLPSEDTEGVNYPSDYIIRLRGVFDTGDLSYEPAPGNEARNIYGTLVPMSEIALFTSEADPTVKPGGGASPPPVDGIIAYHIFATIPKSPGIIFEVDWDLRF